MNYAKFQQSKSANNVCKLLQLLGEFLPQNRYRSFAPGPQTPWAIAPQMKILSDALCILSCQVSLSIMLVQWFLSQQ